MASERFFVVAGGRRLEVERIAPVEPRAQIVLLHEGLGSIAMWREFPHALAQRARCEIIVYSRFGYGRSEPLAGARGVRYMHDEALRTLPELLDALDVAAPVLVGHSDGASIALIHAGANVRPVRGVVALAPHVMVEDLSIRSIAAARTAYDTTDLRARLARYHEDVDSAFRGWNDIWLHPDFRAWNIEAYLPGIACPVLVIQGEDDEYGTMEQVRRISAAVDDASTIALPSCRHSPHRDRPEEVLDAIATFVDRVTSHARRGRIDPIGRSS